MARALARLLRRQARIDILTARRAEAQARAEGEHANTEPQIPDGSGDLYSLAPPQVGGSLPRVSRRQESGGLCGGRNVVEVQLAGSRRHSGHGRRSEASRSNQGCARTARRMKSHQPRKGESVPNE